MLTNSENIEKYDINNFFVGELCLVQKIIPNSNVDKLTKTEKINQKYDLIRKGAIDLSSGDSLADYIDVVNNAKHYKVLTIFYRLNDNFLCLHNGKVYNNNSLDFCTNLIDLYSLLPKVSFYIPNKITIDKALFIFEELFNRAIVLEKIYNNDKYSVDDFYLGSFALHTDFIPLDRKLPKKSVNAYFKHILDKSTKMYAVSSRSDNQFCELPGRYKYNHYKCLFLKTENGLYNVNNFQMYPNIYLEKYNLDEIPKNLSYCEKIIPLTEKIDDFKTSKVTIPRVLSKIKKLKS